MGRTDLTYVQETQTLIGSKKRQLVDMETGEQILVDQITKRVYGTKNFWKVYLMDFLTVLGIIDSRQLDIFIYIAEHTDPSNNIFLGTYTKLGEETGASRQTIAKIMKKLQDNGFIHKIQNGAWRVNPNIMMKGNDQKRQILLSYYESDGENSMTMSRQLREAIPEAEISGQMKLTTDMEVVEDD